MESNNSSYKLILDMHNHIIKNPEWVDFIKNFNDNGGFMYSTDERITDIYNAINAGKTEKDVYSGTLYALNFRACQSIFKGVRTLDDYKT